MPNFETQRLYINLTLSMYVLKVFELILKAPVTLGLYSHGVLNFAERRRVAGKKDLFFVLASFTRR